MKKIYQKFRLWYRGEFPPKSLQEIVDNSIPSYLGNREWEISDKVDPPLFARIINTLCRFWLRRWPILLPVIVMLLGIAVALFIHFDPKSISHTTKETNTYSKYKTFNEILRDHK